MIWFLVSSFLFFLVAVLVEELGMLGSDTELQRDDASGGQLGEDSPPNDQVAVSASREARDDYPVLSSRQLRLVATTWSPFTNAPGKPRFALNLVDEALERIGITAQTSFVDGEGLTSVLVSEVFDGRAAVLGVEDAESAMIYSRPYLEHRLILVGRKPNDVTATSLASLAGSTIALVNGRGYTEADATTDGLVVIRTNREEDSIKTLLNGDADYALLDELVIHYLLNNHGQETHSRLSFGSAPLLTRSLHLAIRRSLPDAETIVSRFNAELRNMIADRTYHRLLLLEWILADVDGDGLEENVPFVDQVRAVPPARSYELFAMDAPATESAATRRFYLDGNMYVDWSAVPDQYKVRTIGSPGPFPVETSTFAFTW